MALDPEDGWSLDLDAVAAAIRPSTRLISINFPHNRTGKILPRGDYEALIELALGPTPQDRFRIGYGRDNVGAALEALRGDLAERRR